MLTPEELEYWRNEARRKAQLDHNSALGEIKRAYLEGFAEGFGSETLRGQLTPDELAYVEGYAQGFAKGYADSHAKWDKIGMIYVLERLLKLPQTPTEQLAGQTLEDLTRLANELEARLVKSR